MKLIHSLLVLFIISILALSILHIYFPFESFESFETNKKYKIGPSDIHGNGIICTQPINNKENIDVAFTFNKHDNSVVITPDFGKYINHKKKANSNLYTENQSVYFIVANKDIHPNEEITVNYDGKDIPHYISRSKLEYKQ